MNCRFALSGFLGCLGGLGVLCLGVGAGVGLGEGCAEGFCDGFDVGAGVGLGVLMVLLGAELRPEDGRDDVTAMKTNISTIMLDPHLRPLQPLHRHFC
jgi:hypothetical protein